jgi:hypothetical protein
MRNPFKRAEARALPRPENELALLATYSGTNITPSAALAIADVWAAVRVLADAASSLPLHVYRKTAAGPERVTSGKLVDLLTFPGPGTTQADLVSSLMTHLAVYGNGFLAKFRSGGDIVQLGLIHPDQVRPELDAGRLRFRYSPSSGPQQLLTGCGNSASDLTRGSPCWRTRRWLVGWVGGGCVGSGCSSSGAAGCPGLGWSGWCGVEGGDADEVVDSGGDLEPGPVALSADVAELAASADGLDPAEGFFDPFPDPHAHLVPGVSGGATVDR